MPATYLLCLKQPRDVPAICNQTKMATTSLRGTDPRLLGLWHKQHAGYAETLLLSSRGWVQIVKRVTEPSYCSAWDPLNSCSPPLA